MPLSTRKYGATAGFAVASPEVAVARARAVEVLTSAELSHIVDLVAWREGDTIHAAAHRGAVSFNALDPTAARTVERGEDILALQDPLALTPLEAELADLRPSRPHYPFAQVRLASALSDPTRSPDLIAVHTDAHHWPERGGHLGEHGNLGVLQSRGPLLISGAQVTHRGVVDSAARTVDVAATLAWLAGAETAALADLDGRPLTELVDRGATYVVGLLMDGANCQALIEGALNGELPALQRLLDRGVALRGGAIAEFPSVTLVNHTSALTGVGPGRHGILNNAFYDRELGAQVLANDSSTWHHACDLLREGVRTLWEMVPDGPTACVNEPIDRGSSYSTMQLIRASGEATGAKVLGDRLPDPDSPRTTRDYLSDPDYAWSSRVDELGLAQMRELWSAPEPPIVTWWNLILTDSAHHVGGAHSPMATAGLRDTDARIGAWLEVVERRGLLDDTVILVTSDHGMTMADPACTGDWDQALAHAGIEFRDEAYGFLYFGTA